MFEIEMAFVNTFIGHFWKETNITTIHEEKKETKHKKECKKMK